MQDGRNFVMVKYFLYRNESEIAHRNKLMFVWNAVKPFKFRQSCLI